MYERKFTHVPKYFQLSQFILVDNLLSLQQTYKKYHLFIWARVFVVWVVKLYKIMYVENVGEENFDNSKHFQHFLTKKIFIYNIFHYNLPV